ncbi:MAG: crossover junction endodeoxyribonuclease RuvC [Ruminococcaceae bacterium]|nr:crossover junction endodeoxyribonuclease RuvC [Oscillospiraceae bacterium]
MRILGIDPGLAIVGWGVIEVVHGRFYPVACGAVTTPAHTPVEERLSMIYDDLSALMDKYQPEEMAIEELFFNHNQTTAIPVAEARGVALLCAKQHGVRVEEYTPMQVKQAVVGYGLAEKRQVISMVTSLLKLPAPPKPDDTADALAIALCHGQNVGSARYMYEKKKEDMGRVGK